MTNVDLASTARTLIAGGKGILAADETVGTLTKRFDGHGIPSTADTRRSYRELFFTTEGIAEFVSGVIMYDETIRQTSATGVPFPDLLAAQGILPGIKVDAGARSFSGFPGELITEGLDDLRTRLAGYRALGARFAKWRAVIAVSDSLPTRACVLANAHALARYAALCQEQELVPIVEPEVLMEGAHALERSEAVTSRVLHDVFNALDDLDVSLEGMLLKPNMVISGLRCPTRAGAETVAAATLRTLSRHVPASVPGIVFLSGGQDYLAATLHLSLINQLPQPKPWTISYSYGRALQDQALATWRGRAESVRDAQHVFYHRARCTSEAALGRYSPSMETQSAVA
jgi:fructose-bisphosphate aldolase class I